MGVSSARDASRLTSCCSCTQVSPIFENTDAEDLSYVEEKDVKMEFYRSSGAGGQVRCFPLSSCSDFIETRRN